MPVLGVGGGAAEAMRQILEDRFKQQQQVFAQQQAQAAAARADQQLGLQRAELEAREGRERTAAQRAQERDVALAQVLNDPAIPEPTRRSIRLNQLGARVSPEDLAPPKPAPTPPRRLVAIKGPKGEKIEKALTDEELAQGVEGYVAPTAPPAEKAKIWVNRAGAPAYVDPSQVRPGDTPFSAAEEGLLKVEHKDPATGKTVIEYLPKREVRGKSYDKGTSATVENRLASAEAVNQTGQDIITKLADPKFAATVGPAMGRYNSLRDFVGNPPPEYADLAGMVESYSLANMGVHGMRSAQGAEMIKRLLDQRHTPQSLIATIKGLNQFSTHFMENEGRPQKTPAAEAAPSNRIYYDATGHQVTR
jgi:hypothetical protein